MYLLEGQVTRRVISEENDQPWVLNCITNAINLYHNNKGPRIEPWFDVDTTSPPSNTELYPLNMTIILI